MCGVLPDVEAGLPDALTVLAALVDLRRQAFDVTRLDGDAQALQERQVRHLAVITVIVVAAHLLAHAAKQQQVLVKTTSKQPLIKQNSQ